MKPVDALSRMSKRALLTTILTEMVGFENRINTQLRTLGVLMADVTTTVTEHGTALLAAITDLQKRIDAKVANDADAMDATEAAPFLDGLDKMKDLVNGMLAGPAMPAAPTPTDAPTTAEQA